MPGQIITEIRGAEELTRLLLQLGPRVARKLGDKALRAGARPILAEAKRLVHVDSGDLRRSLTVRVAKIGDEDTKGVVIGSAGLGWRAHFLEFGTSRLAAYPFLRPAADNKKKEAIDTMIRVLGEGIDKEVKALHPGAR